MYHLFYHLAVRLFFTPWADLVLNTFSFSVQEVFNFGRELAGTSQQ